MRSGILVALEQGWGRSSRCDESSLAVLGRRRGLLLLTIPPPAFRGVFGACMAEDKSLLGHYLAHVVSLAAALGAVYQCSQARAKVAGLDAEVTRSNAETEKLKQQMASAPAERTVQVAQELAKYPDPADKATVLRAVAALDPNPAVRKWAEDELDRLRPELQRLQREASQMLVAATEPSGTAVNPSGLGAGATGGGPVGTAPPVTSPATKLAPSDALKDRSLAFDATLHRATRLDSLLLEPKAVDTRRCIPGTTRGALSGTDSAICQGALDKSGLPQGVDQVHPASGNGMLYWRMKAAGDKLSHCQCQEQTG
jgi:hypothetical protein